jgi:methylthioribose-1-phosphate isomerase
MKLNGQYRRSIERVKGGIEILDQRVLPREIKLVTLKTMEEVAIAIKEMWVRGAPLIGATAAYGLCFALEKNIDLQAAYKTLLATRPTAINLKWSLDQMMEVLAPLKPEQRIEAAYAKAQELCDEDAAIHEAIGTHGLKLFEKIYAEKKRLNILTHCNAGWLACVDWGTALAPIYKVHEKGIPVHVWVDETRPRNQGALTSFELSQAGVPNTVIVDNAGGLLMQQGVIDLCIVGTDRTLRNGDVCNKIGTYLKALAAKDNHVPFYVALPYTTIDWDLADASHIEIEERGQDEVLGAIYAAGTKAANPAFDITPARLVTGFITERGICDAAGLPGLFSKNAL